MTQQQISTISEFLLHAGTDFRVFDMGRTIRPLSTQAFLDMENLLQKPPFPRLQHAWFGIVFWDKHRSAHHYIWFVKLPLDEQGMIVGAARHQFLQIIVEALGTQLENAEKKQGQLPENPFTFVPNQQQLADFNSISRKTLSLGQSSYFDATKAYLASPMVIDWQTLALQGLTDLACEIEQVDIANNLNTHFLTLPQTVQFSLATSFENHILSSTTAEILAKWLKQNPSDPVVWQHGLRALCQCPHQEIVSQLIDNCLDGQLKHDCNTLSVVAGRLWHHFTDPKQLHTFLQCVAEADPEYQLFRGIFTDLVQIPDTRISCLSLLRMPEKSATLTQAIGSIFAVQN